LDEVAGGVELFVVGAGVAVGGGVVGGGVVGGAEGVVGVCVGAAVVGGGGEVAVAVVVEVGDGRIGCGWSCVLGEVAVGAVDVGGGDVAAGVGFEEVAEEVVAWTPSRSTR